MIEIIADEERKRTAAEARKSLRRLNRSVLFRNDMNKAAQAAAAARARDAEIVQEASDFSASLVDACLAAKAAEDKAIAEANAAAGSAERSVEEAEHCARRAENHKKDTSGFNTKAESVLEKCVEERTPRRSMQRRPRLRKASRAVEVHAEKAKLHRDAVRKIQTQKLTAKRRKAEEEADEAKAVEERYAELEKNARAKAAKAASEAQAAADASKSEADGVGKALEQAEEAVKEATTAAEEADAAVENCKNLIALIESLYAKEPPAKMHEQRALDSLEAAEAKAVEAHQSAEAAAEILETVKEKKETAEGEAKELLSLRRRRRRWWMRRIRRWRRRRSKQ